MAGSILHLLFELDTLNTSFCGSADVQGAIISAEVRDAWVGPMVGRSSERVLVRVVLYIMVDLDASLTNITSRKSPLMLEIRSR